MHELSAIRPPRGRLLSPREVAERLSLKRSTIQAWIRGGKLPCYRFGSPGKGCTYRIDEADLVAFLAQHRTGEPAA
jgi:excisionase family DNA binding protein